ncbi:DNA primase family protein [Glaesserella parasuis]|uniref:DNA primase family protein n=1 Tax=Glaesserella parasuis TaxID=738 RepID=UPI003B681164
MKLKNAPNMKQQPPNATAVKIIYGVQAWDFAKLPPVERTRAEIELEEALPSDKANITPIVLGVDELDKIHRLRIAPPTAETITLQRANKGEAIHYNTLTAICLNLAYNTNAKNVKMIDEAEQLLEDLSDYIHRLRTEKDERERAEAITKQDEIILNFADEKPKPRQIVNAFLKWNKKPLRRDVLLSKTYQYNGKVWEFISEEELRRKVYKFYDELDVHFTLNQVNKTAETVNLQIEPLPQENPDYIGFKNGVLNKKTGEFQHHQLDHYIRFIDDFYCKTDSLETPYFNDWINFTSNGNQQKKNAILAGLYMILTNRHEWGLFIEATGTAGAGKSIFGEIATILNGKGNTAIIDLKAFEDLKGRSILVGKTLAYSPDQKPYRGTADDLKAMTGGDPLKVKLLYKDELEIKVNAVFMMSTNYPITFTDRKGGITRRRVIIPFDRAIPKEKKDVHFIEKVRAEVYGITNLLLRTYPKAENARKTLEEYQELNEGVEIKQEANHLIDFAKAFTIQKDSIKGLKWGSNYINSKTTKDNALYKAYLHYCDCQNLKTPLNLSAFKQALPDALKETGEKGEIIQLKSNGIVSTNIHWKHKDQTLNEWES